MPSKRGCCPSRRRQSLLTSLVLVCWASTPPAARCSSIHTHLGQLLLRGVADPSPSSTAKPGRTSQLPAAPPVTIREDKSLAARLQPSLNSAPSDPLWPAHGGLLYGTDHALMSLQSRSPALPLSDPRVVRRVAGIQPEQVLPMRPARTRSVVHGFPVAQELRLDAPS